MSKIFKKSLFLYIVGTLFKKIRRITEQGYCWSSFGKTGCVLSPFWKTHTFREPTYWKYVENMVIRIATRNY